MFNSIRRHDKSEIREEGLPVSQTEMPSYIKILKKYVVTFEHNVDSTIQLHKEYISFNSLPIYSCNRLSSDAAV